MKIRRSYKRCIDDSVPWSERKYEVDTEEFELGDVAGQLLDVGDRVAWVAGSGTDKSLAIGVLKEVRQSKSSSYDGYFNAELVCRAPGSTRDSILSRGFYSKVRDGVLCWNQIVKLGMQYGE